MRAGKYKRKSHPVLILSALVETYALVELYRNTFHNSCTSSVRKIFAESYVRLKLTSRTFYQMCKLFSVSFDAHHVHHVHKIKKQIVHNKFMGFFRRINIKYTYTFMYTYILFTLCFANRYIFLFELRIRRAFLTTRLSQCHSFFN